MPYGGARGAEPPREGKKKKKGGEKRELFWGEKEKEREPKYNPYINKLIFDVIF